MIAAALCAAVATLVTVQPTADRRAQAVLAVGRPRRRPVPIEAWAALSAGIGAAVVLGWPTGVLAAPAVGLGAFQVTRRLESTTSRRHRERVARQLPAVVDLIAAALRSGRPPAAAFACVADGAADPLALDLRRAADRLAVAADPVAVWRDLAGDSALAPIAKALLRAEVAGLPAAGTLALSADELRRECAAAMRGKARGVAVATAAPLGACFLPAFFLVGIAPMVIGLVGGLPR